MNLGTVALFVFIYIIKLIFVFCVLFPMQKCFNSFNATYEKLKSQLFYSDLISIFLEANIEFFLMNMLYFDVPDKNYDKNTTNFSISLIFFIIISVFLPSSIIYVFTRSEQ